MPAFSSPLIWQVRVHGEWEPLMGSPRIRTEDLEARLLKSMGLIYMPHMRYPRANPCLQAPLLHNFSVAHTFDGVRLKVCSQRAVIPLPMMPHQAIQPQTACCLQAGTWKTFNSGGRMSLTKLGREIEPPQTPQMKRSRFVMFDLEKGAHIT
jgi:hypothetical protein